MSFIVLILLMVLIFGSVFDSLGAGFAFTIGFFIFVFIIGLAMCILKDHGYLKDWNINSELDEWRKWDGGDIDDWDGK